MSAKFSRGGSRTFFSSKSMGLYVFNMELFVINKYPYHTKKLKQSPSQDELMYLILIYHIMFSLDMI